MTNDPDLLELTRRLDEAEREVAAAREQCRRLLSALADLSVTIGAGRGALADFDDRQLASEAPMLPAVNGGA